MDNKNLNYGLLGLLIGGALVWLFMSAGGEYWTGGMMGPYRQGQMGSYDHMDAHFIEQMIPHHEDAITMAELALTRSQRPEIRQLAQNIIDSQSAEIEQMQAWYQDWFGRELPTGDQVMMQHSMMGRGGFHMGMLGDETDVARLTQASDFDRAFIEEMIPHHQMAVMMASMLQRGTQRPEMQTLADDIIAAQTSEIEQMREWYNEWF